MKICSLLLTIHVKLSKQLEDCTLLQSSVSSYRYDSDIQYLEL